MLVLGWLDVCLYLYSHARVGFEHKSPVLDQSLGLISSGGSLSVVAVASGVFPQYYTLTPARLAERNKSILVCATAHGNLVGKGRNPTRNLLTCTRASMPSKAHRGQARRPKDAMEVPLIDKRYCILSY